MKTPSRTPSFFIVGAPKSATTAMNDVMARHPRVFMAPKEIHYFGSDLGFGKADTLEDYLAHFRNAGEARVLGEASVWYLCSELAAEEIRAFQPDARILIMLRDPIHMLYSLHSQLLYAGEETVPDFRAALEAEPRRRQGMDIPPRLRGTHRRLLYTEVARYGPQVRRYLDAFGPGRVKVVLFEDFVADPQATSDETLEFLGLDAAAAPERRPVNPHKRLRSPGLRRQLRDPRGPLRRAGRLLLRPSWRRSIARRLRKLNEVEAPRPPMAPDLEARLRASLEPEIRDLAVLLGRDLSPWLSAPDGTGKPSGQP